MPYGTVGISDTEEWYSHNSQYMTRRTGRGDQTPLHYWVGVEGFLTTLPNSIKRKTSSNKSPSPQKLVLSSKKLTLS